MSIKTFIRILYIPTDGTSESPVDFWDYDITDGYIYSAMSGSMGFSGQGIVSIKSLELINIRQIRSIAVTECFFQVDLFDGLFRLDCSIAIQRQLHL